MTSRQTHSFVLSNLLYIPYVLAALQSFFRVFSLLLLWVELSSLGSVSRSSPVSLCDVVFDFRFYVVANPVSYWERMVLFCHCILLNVCMYVCVCEWLTLFDPDVNASFNSSNGMFRIWSSSYGRPHFELSLLQNDFTLHDFILFWRPKDLRAVVPITRESIFSGFGQTECFLVLGWYVCVSIYR